MEHTNQKYPIDVFIKDLFPRLKWDDLGEQIRLFSNSAGHPHSYAIYHGGLAERRERLGKDSEEMLFM